MTVCVLPARRITTVTSVSGFSVEMIEPTSLEDEMSLPLIFVMTSPTLRPAFAAPEPVATPVITAPLTESCIVMPSTAVEPVGGVDGVLLPCRS